MPSLIQSMQNMSRGRRAFHQTIRATSPQCEPFLPSWDSHLAPDFLSGREKLPATSQRVCSWSLSGGRPILASRQRELTPRSCTQLQGCQELASESGEHPELSVPEMDSHSSRTRMAQEVPPCASKRSMWLPLKVPVPDPGPTSAESRLKAPNLGLLVRGISSSAIARSSEHMQLARTLGCRPVCLQIHNISQG